MNEATSRNNRNERRRVNFWDKLATLQRFGLFEGQTQRRRCFYKPVATLERSFCTCEQRTKRKRFTDLRGIRFVCGVLFKRTMCELCSANCIGEPHLNKEYKGLLGTNYANRARLVSVGNLSRETTSRAELTAKPKHNIKSFSKNQGVTVPLRLRALTNKVTK